MDVVVPTICKLNMCCAKQLNHWIHIELITVECSIFTSFLVWIIVLDFQPVECVTFLTSDRNTCIFWEPICLQIQRPALDHLTQVQHKRQKHNEFRGGPSLTPTPTAHAATTSKHASSVSPMGHGLSYSCVRLEGQRYSTMWWAMSWCWITGSTWEEVRRDSWYDAHGLFLCYVLR